MASLQNLLGIRLPIVSAPMAYVSGGDLAGAVSAEGGLGLIGGGYGDLERKELGPEWIHKQFELAHNRFPEHDPSKTSPVGIGFITWALNHNPSLLTEALTHKPKAVFLSFGDPSPYVKQIHDAGAFLICQVQTVEEAKQMAAAGADIIVAQGAEAGGHGAVKSRGVFTLVAAVVDAVGEKVPVLAAGGVGDGRGIAAALALGASGVLMGTRFLVTKESMANEKTKQKVMSIRSEETARTRLWDVMRKLPWPEPYNARTLRNPFSEKWESKQSELTEKEFEEYCKARDEYDFSVYTAWCGESVDFIHEEAPQSVAAVIQQLLKEANEVTQRTQALTSSWFL